MVRRIKTNIEVILNKNNLTDMRKNVRNLNNCFSNHRIFKSATVENYHLS